MWKWKRSSSLCQTGSTSRSTRHTNQTKYRKRTDAGTENRNGTRYTFDNQTRLFTMTFPDGRKGYEGTYKCRVDSLIMQTQSIIKNMDTKWATKQIPNYTRRQNRRILPTLPWFRSDERHHTRNLERLFHTGHISLKHLWRILLRILHNNTLSISYLHHNDGFEEFSVLF